MTSCRRVKLVMSCFPMVDFIFVAGAPGSGKSTVSALLKQRLNARVVFDFGILREPHLNPDWLDASDVEEQMAFENLLFVLRNYHQHGYKNVLVADLRDFRVQEIPLHFEKYSFIIVSLVLNDDAELERRVLDPQRNSGFRDVAKALEWNEKLKERPLVEHEFRFDNSSRDPGRVVGEIIEFLKGME